MRAAFEHVLVDEFQDTNMAQYRLLQLLCGFHNNIFVVGDEDQSIYRWRGADYSNVLRFEDDYPDSQKVLLEQNYRSTQNVLDAARAVIDRNKYRTPKALFSERGAGDKIILYEAVDDHAEASYVVDTIQTLTSGGKGRGGDIAVMYRTNAQSRLLEEAFLRSGMAYRLVGAQRFYGRREVKDMIAYLRLVQNPSDEVSLGRVINVPPRGIGGKTLENLLATARQAQASAGDVLIDLAAKGPESAYAKSFSGRAATLLADFGGRLAAWQEAGASLALPALFDRIAGDIGYREYIEDESEEGQDRWGNVEELRRLAYEYQDKGLTAFLENLALVSDQDTIPETQRFAHFADPARRQGPGILHRDHHRPGRRPAAAQPLTRRPRRNGRGTPPVLRGPDPRQKQSLPGARRTAQHIWIVRKQRKLALPRRHPGCLNPPHGR